VRQHRILLVEDEADVADMIATHLRIAGYETRRADSGSQALLAARKSCPDLVLLDIMLPDMSGFEVCRLLRERPESASIPIIVLSARGEDADRIRGLESGADDYIVKTASPKEILLRIQAVLRRVRSDGLPLAPLKADRLEIDPGARRVHFKGREIPVTALEFRLLHTLMARSGRVQTREILLRDVWGASPDMTTRTVDTHVKRLREKLGEAGTYITTVRGAGYRFEPPKPA